VPKDALRLSPETLEERRLQTRVFEAGEEDVLLASAALLQDLGFTLEESEASLGVVVATRDRDVTNAGQVIAYVILSVMSGVPLSPDEHQKVMASVVTKPVGENRTAVRVTFQHMVWNRAQQLVANERIHEPEIYQEFFSKLSKSLFLQAHEL
jgi:hypothetical protein